MIWRFAWQFLQRDWRTPETKLVLIALVIAVASVVSIGVLNQQVQTALGNQEKRFLGADLIVRSADELPATWVQAAQQRGLQIERTLEFRTVMMAQSGFRLVDVKAVGTDYPLRGEIRIATRSHTDLGNWRSTGPSPGSVWVEPRLIGLLKVQIGAVVRIGVADLTVAGVIQEEPGRASYLLAFAPRVLMHREDIARTQVVRPGSRVHYLYLVKGEDSAVNAFQDWLTPQLSTGQRLLNRANASPALQTTLAKAEEYLALSSLFSILLAGLAVAIAANRYSLRHADTAALLSCLGARPNVIIGVFVIQLLMLALSASVLGGLIGYVSAALLLGLLSDWLPVSLALPNAEPLLVGLLTACVTLFGFALCTTIQLRNVPPTQVLRHAVKPRASQSLVYLLTLLCIALLMWWLSGNAQSTLILLGVCGFMLCCSAVLVFVLLRVSVLVLPWVSGPLRQTLRQISGQRGASMTQIISVALAMMIMLVVLLIRMDLLDDWQAGLPASAHNHFLLNIQPDEVADVQRFLAQKGITPSPFMPMVRGRLMANNGVPIQQAVPAHAQQHNALRRALNLSWSNLIPANNHLLSGVWWGPSEATAVISVESTLAEQLGLVLGDRLRFQIAEQSIEATITSIRQVQWDAFQPNFYVLFRPGALHDFPVNYLTSFYLPADQKNALNDLVTTFPTLTLIEIDALIQAVRTIFAQITAAIAYLALFVLAASLCVLSIALQATQDARLLHAAIIRSIGASRTFIRRMLFVEWVVLGLLAGGLAAAGAEVCAWFLYHHLFQLVPHWHLWLWVTGPVLGVLLVLSMSVRLLNQVLNQPPLSVLRKTVSM